MLTKDEMKVLLSIIEVSAKNGLFRPVDFAIVGDLYQKIQKELTTEE